MTFLSNAAEDFSAEALAGFVAAHPEHVAAVHGGVVRSTESPRGQVAVVVGGGAGHYPAFAGWVGPGLAHGAPVGNVFSSPSASQVYSVARAAHNGGGILLGFGNYAGDVLHFGQAAERLRAEGVDVRILPVTDDVASGPADDPALRRGIAGDLTVFKIAGAAAEAGLDLDAVEAVARRANDRTRSLGVAFDGCTLPGAGHRLFTVPSGRMGVGLGIHGEPGVDERPLGGADEVADLLVDGLLGELPHGEPDGPPVRAAVILNGLGAVKYEELFVVYRRVAQRLGSVGIVPVAPQVGECVTSLDMAGLSLTVLPLDDELERHWTAPADTPALRTGAVDRRPARTEPLGERLEVPVTEGSHASRRLARGIVTALATAAATLDRHEERLGDIDAVAGDGDHGIGMKKGSAAALAAARVAAETGAGAKTTLVRAGDAWSEGAGGTSGALWGAALTAVGSALGDEDPATAGSAAAAARAGLDAITRLGGARPGDKTLVDAAVPFVETLERLTAGGTPPAEAWARAARAATRAAEDTAGIPARLGRARVLGAKSLGTPDAGAVSFALLVTALAPTTVPPASTRSQS